MKAAVHYVLSILEAGLAGATFYEAGQEECPRRKFVLYLCSSISFCLSLLDSLEAFRLWKEARAARKARAAIDIELDEGDYDYE